MKVLAFNCSPNKENGTTAKILNPFLEGISKAGGKVELYYTRDLNMNTCQACTSDCFFDSDGKCQCEDDMNQLYPKFRDADLWVFATPNYVNDTKENIRNLLDRLEPLYQPVLDGNNGLGKNVGSNGFKGSIAYVSAGGTWEKESFNQILGHVKSICNIFDRKFAGALIRPHSWALMALNQIGVSVDDIYAASEKAGRSVVKTGAIPDDLMKIVSRELVPQDSFVEEVNKNIAEQLQNT